MTTTLGLLSLGFAAGAVISAFLLLLVHERREFRRMDAKEAASVIREREREERERTRYELLIKEVRDARHVFLAAGQASNHVAERLEDHDARITALERNVT